MRKSPPRSVSRRHEFREVRFDFGDKSSWSEEALTRALQAQGFKEVTVKSVAAQ